MKLGPASILHLPLVTHLRRVLLIAACCSLPACATWWGDDQERALQQDSGAPKDRSAQRVRIFIKGVDGDQRTAVSGALELKGLMSRADASDSVIKRVHSRAAKQMSKALQPFGYYHAKVSSTLELQGKTWVARFVVDRGAPTLVAQADVSVQGAAAEDVRIKRAIKLFAPATGAVLDHAIYEASKLRIADTLAERGYLDAAMLEHQVAVRLADQSARISLLFESGTRFTFGETQFTGAQLSDSVLRGYLPYRVGQDYRQDRLVELQQRLLDSDYFSEVEIETDQANAREHSVPIVVRVKPAMRTVYTGGVAFGTDSGFGVQGGLTRRWVNSLGHKASARAEISQRLNSLGGQYVIPLPGADRESLNFALSYRDETTDTSEQQLSTVLIARQKEHEFGSLVYGLGAQSGDFIVGELPGSSTLVYPEVRWTRRKTDDFLSPREGWSLTAEARAATSGVGDASFAQVRAEAKLLRPHRENNRWVARLALGALWTDDFESMPPQLRFFAGGDRSLRGFGYQTLGPPNALGNVGGGRYLAVGSFEYERHLFGDFGLAGFVDAGNAFNAGDFDIAAGVGVGLRWRSPVGLVRVDLAQPVAGEGDGMRLHLTIGPEL